MDPGSTGRSGSRQARGTRCRALAGMYTSVIHGCCQGYRKIARSLTRFASTVLGRLSAIGAGLLAGAVAQLSTLFPQYPQLPDAIAM